MDKSKNKVSARAPHHTPTSVWLSVAEQASSPNPRPFIGSGPAIYLGPPRLAKPTDHNIAGVGAARRAQRARAVGVVHLPPPAALPGLAERTPTAALRSASNALRLNDGAAAALTLGNPTPAPRSDGTCTSATRASCRGSRGPMRRSSCSSASSSCRRTRPWSRGTRSRCSTGARPKGTNNERG